MDTSSRRMKETFELFARQGILKGKFFGDNFALPDLVSVINDFIEVGNYIFYAAVSIPLIPIMPRRRSTTPLDWDALMSIISNPLWQIGFGLMLVFIIARKLYKSHLVINFNERKIYSTNYMLGIEIGPRRDEMDLNTVAAIGVDTLISRKREYKNKQLLGEIKFDLDILAQRNIALLKEYYYFTSVIILIFNNGNHINISIDKASDDSLVKFTETAIALSEAFEIPLLACNHEQKIDFPSNKNSNKNAKKESLPNIVSIFSEDDFKKMEKEAIGGPKFVSNYEE